MTEKKELSSKDFDQFEIARIIHLEQIPGYQLLKWERDYIKNYRKALKAEMKEAGVVAAGPMYDESNEKAEDTTEEAVEEEKTEKKTKTKATK